MYLIESTTGSRQWHYGIRGLYVEDNNGRLRYSWRWFDLFINERTAIRRVMVSARYSNTLPCFQSHLKKFLFSRYYQHIQRVRGR